MKRDVTKKPQKENVWSKAIGKKQGETATAKAQAAALALASELGPDRVTIEGIAIRSGVAKTTLYRRWPNAAAAVMDAFLADVHPLIAYREGVTLRDTLCNALNDLARALDEPRRSLLRHLVGAAQSNEKLGEAFWDNWIRPRRAEGAQTMIAAGLREHDAQIILDLIFGAFYYRMLIPYAPINEEWVAEIVDRVLPPTL